ncbi:hypothetical protein DdX_13112 [Ditylenchus destructor]|uniref:RRM domain-containing protein n=1 Tax=Ditylenchus destructor TaxID=166010 RepID=A0AAD4MTH0_9BILA|nr:hypothetical protein DdX_13112 [Ditylenchus destructor]
MTARRARPHLNIESDYLVLISNIRQNNWIKLRRALANKQEVGLKFVEDFSAWIGRNSNHKILEFVDSWSLEKFAANVYDVVDKNVEGYIIEPENRHEFFDTILARTGVDLLGCNGIPSQTPRSYEPNVQPKPPAVQNSDWQKFDNSPTQTPSQLNVEGEYSLTLRTNEVNGPANRNSGSKSYDNGPAQTPSQLNVESEYSQTLRTNEANGPSNIDSKSYDNNTAQSRPRMNVESDYLVLVANFPRCSWKAFKENVKRKYGIALIFVETFSAWRVPQSSHVVLEFDNYQSVQTFTEKFRDIVGGNAEYEVLDVKHRDAFFKRICQLTGVDMYTPQADHPEDAFDENGKEENGNAQPVSTHSISNCSQLSQCGSNRAQADLNGEPESQSESKQSDSKQIWVQSPSTSCINDVRTEHATTPLNSHINVNSDLLMGLWNVSDQNWEKFKSEFCKTLDLRFIDAFDRWGAKQVVLEFGNLDSLTEFVECLPSFFGNSIDYNILDVDDRVAFFNLAYYKTGVDLNAIQETIIEEQTYGDPNQLLQGEFTRSEADTQRRATYIFDDVSSFDLNLTFDSSQNSTCIAYGHGSDVANYGYSSDDGGGFYVLFRNIPNNWITKQVQDLAQTAGKTGSITQISSFVVRYENPEEATGNDCDSDGESSIFAHTSSSESTLIEQGKYGKENNVSCSIIIENVPHTWNCDYMTDLAGEAGTVTSCRQISNAIVEYRNIECQLKAVSLFQGLLLPGGIVKIEKCDANGGYPCLEFDWDDGRFSIK